MITINQDKEKSITISGFEAGVSESPVSGFFQMVNANNHASPGVMKSNLRIERCTKLYNYGSNIALTFTASDSGGKLLLTNTANLEADSISIDNQAFTVTNVGGALPTGLAASTIYYAIRVSNTSIKVATTLANAETGTAINYTNAGSGTNTIVPINPSGIVEFATDESQSTICAIDEDGRAWRSRVYSPKWELLDGNTSAIGGDGYGVAFWKNYWFFFSSTKVDVITATNVNNRVATWADIDWTPTGWAALGAGSRHHRSLVGQDGILYICNGKYIATFKEVSGATFDPANNATYVVNTKALDLPFDSTCLEELRTDLMIGTKSDKVYFWDRLSPSFTFPLIIPERYTYDMVNIDNIVYLFSGNSGTIYKTNGVSSDIAVRIPTHISNYYYSPVGNQITFNQADAMAKRIVFTTTMLYGYPGGENVINAVWSYYPNKNSLIVENTITDVAELSNFRFYAIKPIDQKTYFVSYHKDGFSLPNDYAIATQDLQGNTQSTCGSYSTTLFLDTPPYAITELLSLGGHLNTATINQVEITTMEALRSGESVDIYYRTTINGTWTLLKSIDRSITGATTTFNSIITEAPLSGIKEIQFKIVTNNGNKLPNNGQAQVSCIALKKVRLILG